ncbi:uncharacterized protein LOC119464626 [Dermacentor silvarum]|uniref:uncharacterized protein LOC119464626 n=1 Tax=Dermacentor silvarum TaxID=543639 RepID=UPI002101565D|nr:uncharacterized protein LOC119464626 [Dermacentor silvarum]
MSSTPVSGQTNNANASLTDQVLLPQSRNPAILQQMQQIPTEQQDVTYATGSSQQACSPPCNFNVSFLQQGALQVNLTAVKIQASPKRPTPDRRCKVIATLPTYKCGQKWFFNKRTRTCLPSCSRRAPFRSKIACDGVCRSVGVCDFPMASIGCFREVHEVFIYNPNQNSCFKAYDCSYFGNKFPTLQQCQKTCRKGASQQHLAGSGVDTPLASTPIQNAGSTVGLQPALSHSGTSLGPGLFGTQTGAAHVLTTSLQGSSQSSGSGSLFIEQHGQTGPALTAQKAGTR